MTAERPTDVLAPRPVVRSEVVHAGMIWDVVKDTVDLGRAGTVHREYIRHPGAVAVIALDDEDRVLLLSQYRHPARQEMWEPPAGLLDVQGEDLVAAAARELAEEADLVAGAWWVLTDFMTSPGSSDESVRIFLARDLSPVPDGARHVREAEESDLKTRWFSLDDVVAAVLEGQVRNPSTAVGILAAWVSRAGGWAGLRPVAPPSL
ncbi:NUDIX hydrolase [Actinotalea sp. K2]|uniref:NUDIX domain-containing protein n=1 Tax=Actinotalea sp. K2 TaxID=2939438 RepID=UPI002016F61B|nr:NUDIX hydrolase [Actinotalea sp. K2]MCL3861968.1 NUDIX hydrolase [Actinotalea sp. K2]